MRLNKRVAELEKMVGTERVISHELNLTPEEMQAEYNAAGHCSEPVIVQTVDGKAVALNDLRGSDLAKSYYDYLNG